MLQNFVSCQKSSRKK